MFVALTPALKCQYTQPIDKLTLSISMLSPTWPFCDRLAGTLAHKSLCGVIMPVFLQRHLLSIYITCIVFKLPSSFLSLLTPRSTGEQPQWLTISQTLITRSPLIDHLTSRIQGWAIREDTDSMSVRSSWRVVTEFEECYKCRLEEFNLIQNSIQMLWTKLKCLSDIADNYQGQVVVRQVRGQALTRRPSNQNHHQPHHLLHQRFLLSANSCTILHNSSYNHR